jgi:hypothetical protein
VGDNIKLTVNRNGQITDLTATLQARPQTISSSSSSQNQLQAPGVASTPELPQNRFPPPQVPQLLPWPKFEASQVSRTENLMTRFRIAIIGNHGEHTCWLWLLRLSVCLLLSWARRWLGTNGAAQSSDTNLLLVVIISKLLHCCKSKLDLGAILTDHDRNSSFVSYLQKKFCCSIREAVCRFTYATVTRFHVMLRSGSYSFLRQLTS